MSRISSSGLEIGVGLAVLDVGPEAADAGDGSARRPRDAADFARQRQQRERPSRESTSSGAMPFGSDGALRLFAFALAELHIGAEAAAAQSDLEAGLGIVAEHFLAVPIAVGSRRPWRSTSGRV